MMPDDRLPILPAKRRVNLPPPDAALAGSEPTPDERMRALLAEGAALAQDTCTTWADYIHASITGSNARGDLGRIAARGIILRANLRDWAERAAAAAAKEPK